MKRAIVILGVLSLSLSSVMVRLSTAPSSILVVYRVFFTLLMLAPPVLLRNRQELMALGRRELLLCLAREGTGKGQMPPVCKGLGVY